MRSQILSWKFFIGLTPDLPYFSDTSPSTDDEEYLVEVCELQAWGLHQCSSKTIPAVFRTVRNREGLTISKELLSTEEPIYYYSYSLTLEGNCRVASTKNKPTLEKLHWIFNIKYDPINYKT